MANILVVDDELTNRDLIGYLMRSGGHDVITVANGAAALSSARASHPELVVMDLAMAGMDGYETMRAMRADPALAGVPVVAVSATDMATDLTAREAGFDGFYALPLDPAHIVAELERYLAPPRAAGAGEPGGRGSS